jgi:hypothetical protein
VVVCWQQLLAARHYLAALLLLLLLRVLLLPGCQSLLWLLVLLTWHHPRQALHQKRGLRNTANKPSNRHLVSEPR